MPPPPVYSTTTFCFPSHPSTIFLLSHRQNQEMPSILVNSKKNAAHHIYPTNSLKCNLEQVDKKKQEKIHRWKPITTTPCSPKCDGKASTKMPGRVNISPWQDTKTRKKIALPETNIFAPENRPSQKGIHLPTNHWFEGVNYQFQGGSLGSIFVKLAIPMLDMSVGYVHLSILAIRASATKSSAPLNPIPSYHGGLKMSLSPVFFVKAVSKVDFSYILYYLDDQWKHSKSLSVAANRSHSPSFTLLSKWLVPSWYILCFNLC